MNFLGIEFDEGKNNLRAAGMSAINTDNSIVKMLIVPTNEEREMVEQCYELLNKYGRSWH